MPHQALCSMPSPHVYSIWSYGFETARLCFDLCDLDLWPLTLTFCTDITPVNGNNSWKFHDDTMTGTWWKRCHRQTDGQTDGRTDWTILRAAWSQLRKKQVWRWPENPPKFPPLHNHCDVIKWKHSPRYWPFVRGIHRSPVDSPHKGQWRGTLMLSLICAITNGRSNNWNAIALIMTSLQCRPWRRSM